MTAAYGMSWFREMLWTALLTGGPPVLAVVSVGLLMAILQAATQVNDQAVAFAPKGLAIVAALAIAGPWMLTQLAEFMTSAFAAMGHVHP